MNRIHVIASAIAAMTASGSAQAVPKGTVIHAFTDKGAGDTPMFGTLVQDSAGIIYGISSGQGTTIKAAHGTVFEIVPPASGNSKWLFTSIYKFPQPQDNVPDYPVGGLAIDPSGNLYGTTTGGLIFELSPPTGGNTKWTYQSIANLQSQGVTLVGGLLVSPTGTLFGVSSSSTGVNLNGSVFALTPPAPGQGSWSYSLLYAFQGLPDGILPSAGLILDATGNLYGTTSYGGQADGGTVFKLTPPQTGQGSWEETQLYAFKGGTGDGESPICSLFLEPSGNLIGTTAFGGKSNNGTIFELAPPGAGQTVWSEAILYQFSGLTYAGPYGGVVGGTGNDLYGSTSSGPGTFGTVFKLTPPAQGKSKWTIRTLWDFPTEASGHSPQGNLLVKSNGSIYGTTEGGGLSKCKNDSYCGTVFEVKQ